jgi:hypothetical protein
MGYTKQQIARWKTYDRWWTLIFKARVADVIRGVDSNGHPIVIKFFGEVSSPGPGNRGSVSQRTVALGIEGATGNVDLERFDLSAYSLDLYTREHGQLVPIPTPRQFLKAPAQQLIIWFDPSAVNRDIDYLGKEQA